MAKILWSIFTDDMNHCMYTGSEIVERHHILSKNKRNKAKSEEYGYIAPLHPTLHPNGANCEHSERTRQIDYELKNKCYLDFLEKHGTKEDFIRIFGKAYE